MRYLPLTDADRREMLAAIGARSVDELFRDVPESARLGGKIARLPDHQGELEVERAHAANGTRVDLLVRGKPVPAEIAPMPFVKHAYYRG